MSITSKRISVLFLIPVVFLTFQSNLPKNFPPIVKQNRDKISDTSRIIIDSNCSLQDALSGIDIPANIKNLLIIIDVYYYSFDARLHKGQIVINKELAGDIKEIFELIREKKFPIKKAVPIFKYNWNDETSMEDNNTTAFNFRKIKGTHIMSLHATGRAIDINPRLNPQIKGRTTVPEGSFYNTKKPGTITKTSFIVKFFLIRGWHWGGNWKNSKDYQHFEKKGL